MVKLTKIILLLIGIACFCFFTQLSFAGPNVLTNVKVIHASTGSKNVDPALRSIIPELRSVFKYSSYKLLKNKNLNLNFNQEGRVMLPGKRTLVVMPSDMDGKRISYQIKINKNNRQVFQTRISLKNNRSITIGGPKFKDGYLLFNISGSMP